MQCIPWVPHTSVVSSRLIDALPKGVTPTASTFTPPGSALEGKRAGDGYGGGG